MRYVFSLLFGLFCGTSLLAATKTPNVVLIYADDLGYGDLGCYGAKEWKTPHLDRLAKQGMCFTSFYSAQPVCSASRTALLTGCYPNRLGLHGALGPSSRHGIHDKETTLAELVKQKNYATAIIGKWHLGHHPMFLPTRHGFDFYFGLPYSNDMWPNHPEQPKNYPPLPLLENEKTLNPNVSAADQSQLTTQYTEKAIRFIQQNKQKPFFLYLAHSMPHVPLFVSERHKGSSKQGTYGDVIQEIDWSVGEILKTLEQEKLDQDTIVLFSSDNGPWLSYGNHAGRAGPLREGKGTIWEGGVRVPLLARWPGHIPQGTECSEPAMTIDLFPTIAEVIDAQLPTVSIDGKSIRKLLQAEKGAKSPHEVLYFYYNNNELQALRSGPWKLILPHTYRSMKDQPAGRDGKPGRYKQVPIQKPELYNLESDVGETNNVIAQQADLVQQLLQYAQAARNDMGDTLTKHPGKNLRQPGRLPDK